MNFDIVYLPPVHPIGEVNRKGRNTPAEPGGTIHPDPRDVGSPWAIGSKYGGHDAIHPELGTIEDFDEFVSAARDRGLEVALDLALQCAPDHPWVTAHPEWFTTRPDGSIAYAENPPKKYQDIYPMNFDNDPDGVYDEVLRVVRFWIDHGVTRVSCRQPTHQADQLLGVADRQGARDEPGGDLPRGGVHQARDDARAGAHRLLAVLHLLHLAHRQAGDHRLRGGARRGLGLHAPQLLSEHAGHPARLAAERWTPDLRDPRGAGVDAVADLGRVLRIRAVRARGRASGQRGVQELGEVPAAPAGLRRRRCSRAAPCSR